MQVSQIIEALIFSADAPVKPAQFLEWWEHEQFVEWELTPESLQDILEGLVEKFQGAEHVFELLQVDGGYQFYTKREFYPYVRQAAVQKNKRKLSRASLETLSIIAYRQPITKTEVEFIRGVNCDYAVRKLLDRNLLEILGRSDAPGRPLLYGTSRFFMEYFGLNDLKDLPRLEEVSIDEGTLQEQYKVYLKDKNGDQSGATGTETLGDRDEGNGTKEE